MGTPFLSEIRIFSFDYPPRGWAFCNGQQLPISQNQGLFSLLGTTYGGNGQTTFALPNLQGRVPIHFGQGYTLGQAAGSTSVTVNASQMPTHTHVLNAQTAIQVADENAQDPTNRVLAAPTVALQGGNSVAVQMYGPFANLTTLNPQAVRNSGGSQAHENMMPYLTLNFCISLQGMFPSQT